jgi:hypothetical protein
VVADAAAEDELDLVGAAEVEVVGHQCLEQAAGPAGDVNDQGAADLDLAHRQLPPVPGGLDSGQGMPGLGVPQLQGGDGAGPSTGEPAAGFVVGDIQREAQLERSSEQRRGRRIPLRQPQRERLQQDVNRTRRIGTWGRGARRLDRRRHAAGAAQVAGPHRGPERLQVCVAGQASVERLQPPGRAQQQPSSVAGALLHQHDQSAQLFHLGSRQSVKRPSLDLDQQAQCRVQRAGIPLGPGRRQQAPGTASGLGR